MIVSIVFHIILAAVATYLGVQTFAPRKQTFKAGSPGDKQSRGAAQSCVQEDAEHAEDAKKSLNFAKMAFRQGLLDDE